MSHTMNTLQRSKPKSCCIAAAKGVEAEMKVPGRTELGEGELKAEKVDELPVFTLFRARSDEIVADPQ